MPRVICRLIKAIFQAIADEARCHYKKPPLILTKGDFALSEMITWSQVEFYILDYSLVTQLN